jgi:cell division protein YceG involved in septum cleavage
VPADRSQTSVRTEEERERARAERARRRAAGSQPVGDASASAPSQVPLPPPAVSAQATPPPTPATPPSARPPALPGRKRGRPLVWVLVLCALVIVAGVAWLAVDRFKHANPAPKTVAAPVVVRVLIPEGETRRQIAIRAHAAGLSGSYLAASARSSLLDPVRYGAPAGTTSLEGFLFPATYELYAGAPAGQLVSEQLQAFTERFGPRQIAAAQTLRETPYELLIVASMVEREAKLPGDRPKIAAVIYNRLRDGMPLGIDATIYYAVEQQQQIPTYAGELTEAQLHIDSPYNTRLHTGLPPTPISNPGMASIEAAAHPAPVPYLYYVAGADGCGEQVFSTTATEFEANVAAYKAAVARNGGKPPVCRHK